MAEIRKLIRSAVFAGRFWPMSAAQATWAPLQKLVARTIGCLNKHLAQNMKCQQLDDEWEISKSTIHTQNIQNYSVLEMQKS